MTKIRNALILTIFIAGAIGSSAGEALGRVIVCERDFQTRLGSHTDSWAQFGLELAIGRPESSGNQGGISTFLAIESAGPPSKPARERTSDEVKAVGVPLGMPPCSTSLSQVHGSGVGGLLLRSTLELPSQDDLLTAVPSESRLMRPSGPKNRWFRPPRTWL